MYKSHQPVLWQECLEFLAPDENFFPASQQQKLGMMDLTFGAGGHSKLFLDKFPHLFLDAFDQDFEAIQNGKLFLQTHNLESRATLHHCNMLQFPNFLEHNKLLPTAIILADLGVSSHHFDSAERGFSFRFDGPLDMRMDQRTETTAADVVNTLSLEELAEIFKTLGEEPFADRIAQKILEQRKISPIKTTKDLENICFHCYPSKLRFGARHPATLVFQALRLYINEELVVLNKIIPMLWEQLSIGGKLGIISFHSLEDRIVKHQFLQWKADRYSTKKVGNILTKRPITATPEELNHNPRARSAKLRVIQKMGDTIV